MRYLLSALLLAGLLLHNGCTHPQIDTQGDSDLKTLPVSESFTFSTTRDIQLNVQVAAPAQPDERYRINVYDDLPGTGSLIMAGLTKPNEVLQLEFRVPAPQTFLYVEKVDPYGNRQYSKVSAKDYESLNFLTTTPTMGLRAAATGSGIDCTKGATKVYTNYNGRLDVNAGEVVSLTGSFSGDLNIRGGIVHICGTASINNLSLDRDESQLYFLEGASVTVANLNLNASKARAYNYAGSLVLNGSASLGGNFENYSKLTINGDLNLNNGTFLNNGELTVAGSVNNNRSFTNNGSLLVKGSFRANGGSSTVNSCKLIVNDELTLNKDLTNNAYIRTVNRLTINGGAMLTMNEGAFVTTRDAMINGSISGTGTSKSTLKVSGNTTFNGGSTLRGNLNYCDVNGVEVNNSKVPATFLNCSNYIPTSACNPDGFGQAIQDTDKDGVVDAQDEYPKDPARAFNTYYPSATGWATYAFEDMWPHLGDYDFNDLVVYYRMTRILNANNLVVDLKMDASVQAVGAGYTNGFGFQLDGINSSEVANVAGSSLTKGLVHLNANKTEADQTKAVIIGFDTPEPLIQRSSGQYFNTVKDSPRGTSLPLALTVNFRSPVAQSRLAQSTVNPFIFIGGNRGREVHLLNYAPTSKISQNLLGSADDKSVPKSGRYYRGENNLPWALDIANPFVYPVEGVPIPSAYLHFNQWAISSGKQYADWYQNKSGNTNSKKVY